MRFNKSPTGSRYNESKYDLHLHSSCNRHEALGWNSQPPIAWCSFNSAFQGTITCGMSTVLLLQESHSPIKQIIKFQTPLRLGAITTSAEYAVHLQSKAQSFYTSQSGNSKFMLIMPRCVLCVCVCVHACACFKASLMLFCCMKSSLHQEASLCHAASAITLT